MTDTGAMSLFAESFEPADPPEQTVCPACGTGTPHRYHRPLCLRCYLAGHDAPRLELEHAEPEPEPTAPSSPARARVIGPGGIELGTVTFSE